MKRISRPDLLPYRPDPATQKKYWMETNKKRSIMSKFCRDAAFVLGILLSFCFQCTTKETGGDSGNKKYTWDEFNMGVDISYVTQVEDYGGIYRDSGKVKDAFQILKDHGANTVRLRLWHTPTWVANLNNGKAYCDLYDTEKKIRRAREAGLAINLDLHYSDRWADPDHQETPSAWTGLSLSILKDSIYNYTLAVLNYLKSKDLVPEMVQVGNEINNGICWPAGKVINNDYTAFAELLRSGIRAVRDFSVGSVIKPKVIIHVAQLQFAGDWTRQVMNKGVTDFDILGLSHYTKWSTVKTMKGVTDTIRMLRSNFGKTVMVVETAYPWTGDNADNYTNIMSPADSASGYGISKSSQLQYMKDLVQAIINGGGKGIQYWEPAWITSRLNDGWGIGSAWDNVTLFDFNGNVLPGADYMISLYKF
jgi:arabinogalactan endo-1,4-beta-galactosidase